MGSLIFALKTVFAKCFGAYIKVFLIWHLDHDLTLFNIFQQFLKVWAGNEDCVPVTWRDCKLVPKPVLFTVPNVTCKDSEIIIDYKICKDVPKSRMITR